MSAPLPGMDPWLESPQQWGDFHHSLAGEIRNTLNNELPEPYYARLEMRAEVGLVVDDSHPRQIVPDVTIVRPLGAPDRGAAAAIAEPRAEISFSQEVELLEERIHHYFVEIRDARQHHRLVTLIEILSPSNKLRGADRDVYLRKQSAILASDAHLIEIDLLRIGERAVSSEVFSAQLAEVTRGRPYAVFINRAVPPHSGWLRLKTQVFASGIREMLPVIPIPLEPGVSEPTLDLQYVFQRVYDDGPYRRGAVDYSQPADPPLSADDDRWARQLLAEAGLLKPADGTQNGTET